jgi:hypothetical protein
MFSSNRVSFAACLFGVTLFFSAPLTVDTSTKTPSGAATAVAHGVSVTPAAATAEEQPANTGGHVLTFTVTNTGTESNTYEITCVGVARAKCSGWSPERLTLGAGQRASVDATFEVLDPGTGLLSLIAFSATTRTQGRGSFRVPVVQ